MVCKSNGSGLDFDVLSRPEERGGKPHRRANAIFWIILANIGIYLADHVFQLVEEEEGNFALWLCYVLTGVGANLVSWLVLPRNAVSIGASGAVFGLFTISVLVKMSWDWTKILEVLILGQFVIEMVMEAAQASTALSGSFGRNLLMNVNHIAHLSGAFVGVFLVWIVSKVPS